MATKKPEQARRLEYMPLSGIKPNPNNPKNHDHAGIERSISRYGLAEVPLLDERTGQLVAGHGRLHDLAARHAEGQAPPEGVQLAGDGEWLVPVIRGWASRSDAEADAYLVASNQLTVNGGWNDEALAELLAGIAAHDYDLALIAGWDPDELAALLDPPEADPIETNPETQAAYAETPEEEAARAARIGAERPKAPAGLTEVTLVLSLADRDELTRLIGHARERLGEDLPAAQVVLAALRQLTGRH